MLVPLRVFLLIYGRAKPSRHATRVQANVAKESAMPHGALYSLDSAVFHEFVPGLRGEVRGLGESSFSPFGCSRLQWSSKRGYPL